jgi:oligoribonuclease (3'-5' exoribonuclease)
VRFLKETTHTHTHTHTHTRTAEEQVKFLKEQLPTVEDSFFDYLRSLDCSQVKLYAFEEGSILYL